MRRELSLKILRLAATAAMVSACTLALAKPGDTLQAFLTYNATHDSNIYRAASGEQSDLYQQLGAGVLLDWKQRRQQVTGRLGANKTTFSDLSVLDFNGYDALGQWNWQLGNRLSGQLGYSASRSLGSFLDYGGALAQNTVDRDRKFFNGNYLFHPRWRANAALESNQIEYSAASLKGSNHTLDAAEVGLDYLTPKGSRLGAYYRTSDGDYPNRQVLLFSTVDNSYKQDDVGLRADWALDGKVRLSGRLGQTRRDHDEVPARDFTGLTGRVDASWQATGKLRIGGALYRDIGAVDDIYASYSVNNGFRITPTWQIGYKLSVEGQAYVERRSFEGDPFAIGVDRKDDAEGYGLTLSYQPRQWANLGVSWQGGKRDSNLVNDFTYQTLSLSAQLVF